MVFMGRHAHGVGHVPVSSGPFKYDNASYASSACLLYESYPAETMVEGLPRARSCVCVRVRVRVHVHVCVCVFVCVHARV